MTERTLLYLLKNWKDACTISQTRTDRIVTGYCQACSIDQKKECRQAYIEIRRVVSFSKRKFQPHIAGD